MKSEDDPRAYWDDVEAIFAKALDLSGPAREALLAAHPSHRAEVESLLAAHARAEQSVSARAARTGPASAAEVIGAFRLVEPIGAGGMGTVYRAERADGAFEQQVAVKLIATSMQHPGAARRFRAERQILASLRHPHIVTLLDAGVTEGGQAYLVMEYVEGTPITTYCRSRALPLDARLRLFRQVCAAVHHAHRHSVVHRDLKPANIMVTAEGVPKVLDFGIARLLDASSGDAAAAMTMTGAVPLTPNYASPEQLRGLPVTTSSDVYALGVLLYELVAGVRPYETAGKPLDEVMRLVVDAEPPRPSAAAERALPYDARRALKGDLDAIVLRAMSKEPERRYGSADELGEDIGRFLDRRPVQARSPSLGYVVGRLAAAHRTAVLSAAIALVLVVAALMVAIWQARLATAERARAERRFTEVRELADTMIFRIHDAVARLPGSTPVRQTIVTEALRYLERLAADAGGDTLLKQDIARAYTQIGKVQGGPGAANLGDREGAVQSFSTARALLSPALRPDAPVALVSDYVEATRRLAETLLSVPGRQADARGVAEEAVAAADALGRRRPADENAQGLLAAALFTVAVTIDGDEALPYWSRAGALYERLLAARPDDPAAQRNVALVEKYLATIYFDGGDNSRALEHHQRARALDEKRLAADPGNRQAQLDVAFDLGNVAHVLTRQRRLRDGAEYYERSLAIRQALANSDPDDALAASRVAFAHGQLASIYQDLGRLRLAYDHAQAAVAIHAAAPSHDVTTRRNLASALRTVGTIDDARGRPREACAAWGRAYDILRTLEPRERGEGIDRKIDPLDGLATRVSACRARVAAK